MHSGRTRRKVMDSSCQKCSHRRAFQTQAFSRIIAHHFSCCMMRGVQCNRIGVVADAVDAVASSAARIAAGPPHWATDAIDFSFVQKFISSPTVDPKCALPLSYAQKSNIFVHNMFACNHLEKRPHALPARVSSGRF